MSRRLVVDGRPLVGERTGIGVHTAEIVSRLEGFDVVIGSHAPIADTSGIESSRFRVDRYPLGVLWQQFGLPRVAREEKAEVLWGPHGTLPWTVKLPAVITIHDLTSIHMAHHHRLKTLLSFNPMIHHSVETAAAIVAVSRHTADALVRGFDVRAERIEVIPNGVSEFFSPGEGDDSIGASYILYAGALEPRKGIGDLIEAWSGLKSRPKLVLAGAAGWKNASIHRRAARWIETGEIVVTGYVSRERLRALYRGATLFVYPSHFEGFGIPVLEAMACGAPVVTTSGGALPEIADNAAIVVPPADPESLQHAIHTLLTSRGQWEELRARGLERVKQFSWDTSAARFSEVLNRAAESAR